MDLMIYDGSIISLSPERNPEIFLAAVCGLGACGIILNVTLQCEAAYNLQMRQYGLNLKDVSFSQLCLLNLYLLCSKIMY